MDQIQARPSSEASQRDEVEENIWGDASRMDEPNERDEWTTLRRFSRCMQAALAFNSVVLTANFLQFRD
jgi:hypothetical protein